jgi:hypothetical protein
MAGAIYDWSLTAADNATADGSINWAENQLPSTVNNSSRASMAAIASLIKDMGGTVTTGGTANAQTATMNVAFSSLATGRMITVKAGASNTTAATLNVNAIGAKAIKKYNATGEVDVAANDIRSGGIYTFRYDAAANSAAGAWILINPSIGSLSTGTITSTGDVTWTGDTPTTWSPTLSASSGSVTASASVAVYKKFGKLVWFTLIFAVSNAGTGTGALRFTLPSTPGYGGSCFGFENVNTGFGVTGKISGGSAVVDCTFSSDNTYPGALNAQLRFTGTYYE